MKSGVDWCLARDGHHDGAVGVAGPLEREHDVDNDDGPEGQLSAAVTSRAPEDGGAGGGHDELEPDEQADRAAFEQGAGDWIQLVEWREAMGPDGEKQIGQAQDPEEREQLAHTAATAGKKLKRSVPREVRHNNVPSVGDRTVRGGG